MRNKLPIAAGLLIACVFVGPKFTTISNGPDQYYLLNIPKDKLDKGIEKQYMDSDQKERTRTHPSYAESQIADFHQEDTISLVRPTLSKEQEMYETEFNEVVVISGNSLDSANLLRNRISPIPAFLVK